MTVRLARFYAAAMAPGNAPLNIPAPPRRRAQPEAGVQKAVTDLLRVYERQGKLVWFPIPNGAKIFGTPTQRAIIVRRMKDQGYLRPGVSDIGIVIASTGRGAMLELKAGHERGSEAQEEFGLAIQNARGLFAICGSLEQGKATVDRWLEVEAGRAAKLAADAARRRGGAV